MALMGGQDQEHNRSDWKYWVDVLRGIFGAEESHPHGSDFAEAIIDHFRGGCVLEDTVIGQWFATLEAAEAISDSSSGEFEARFFLSREQHPVPEDVWERPVHPAIRVIRNYYYQPQPTQREALILFFSFTDVLPVRQNLKLFKECAISRLRNLKKHPLQREMEMEESAAGAVGAD